VASVLRLPLRDDYFAEHARLHVIEEVAVIGPTAECIGGDRVAQALCRLNRQRMLTHLEFSLLIQQFTPHSVQMDRVRHHRVVHERDAQALAVVEAQRLGFRKLAAIERPDEALHVPCRADQ